MLANMGYGPHAVKAWADQWGLLTIAEEAPVTEFYDAANKLSSQCYAFHMGYRQFALSKIYYPPNHRGGLTEQLTVEFVPRDLFSYCWYELVGLLEDMQRRGLRFSRCDYCGAVYLPRNRARPDQSRFCNHNARSCKNAFGNQDNLAPKCGDAAANGRDRALDEIIATYGRR